MSFAKIRPRRGTASQWATIDPVLAEGEIGIEVPDSGVGTGAVNIKFGDGVKKWSELPYGIANVLTKSDVVDNLLSNRVDLPVSANQVRIVNEKANNIDNRVGLLEARTKITDTSTVETKSFDINEHGTYLLFCQQNGKPTFAIYYVKVSCMIIALIAGTDLWGVSFSDDKTKLNIANTNFYDHPWGQYILHSVGW